MAEFDSDNNERKNEIYSIPIRAGKRTYFFDVKATRSDELYLTITESKRRFSNENGKFFYEKHKIFLYKEDFEKFTAGINDAIHFIRTGERPVLSEAIDDLGNDPEHINPDSQEKKIHLDVSFDDLKSNDE
ncbi:MAG: DUF3276 family protein [Bacteroidales bacterium]|jgi:hypothetical protein|nr:PUR family DNA/RNA-binding protein [Bacteroidales bacterium]MDD2322862.1 DUF3276 family protein [Bacteroidales bacterium]MDD3010364.1 DUF3276 family protein [Bacteroidales bacterium]MDD3962517.1 DUF3276 family protein [Bacteroidales bacterium]MDY0285089.1 DUF3276 family protein [Bacteroidales bacterium]